jgi:hypothetical protein
MPNKPVETASEASDSTGGPGAVRAVVDVVLQSLPLVFVGLGIILGAWQFADGNRNSYEQAIWTAQKALYQEAITAASKVANGKDLASVAEQRQTFWELHWGVFAMLASKNVEKAMDEFKKILVKCEKSRDASCFPVAGSGKPTELQTATQDLAYCARKSLMDTWTKAALTDLKGGTCPYNVE